MRAARDGLLMELAAASLGVLLLVLVVFFTPPSILGSVDYIHFYQPNFRFLFESLHAGEIPWWNPHIGLGRPFVGDLQNAVFYPPLYLLIAGEWTGAVLLVWAHGLLAVLGLRWLGSLLGMGRGVSYLLGVTFLLAPPWAGRLFAGQLLYACGLCYLPILYALTAAAESGWNLRRTIGHATCLALQFLCGHPQVFWLSVLGQGAFLVGRAIDADARSTFHRLGHAGGQMTAALVGAVALVAVALLPFLELIAQGNREEGSPTLARFNQMHIGHLLSLAGIKVPGAVISWEGNLFVGPALLLAGWAGLTRVRDRNARGLLFSALLGLMIAFGDRVPWSDVLIHALPGYSKLRLHVRAGVLVVFAVMLGAGLWLSWPHPWLQLFWKTNVGLPLRHLGNVFVAVHLLSLTAGTASAKWHYSYRNLMGSALNLRFERELVDRLRETGALQPGAPPPRVFISQKLVPINRAMIQGYAHFDAYTSLFLQRPWAALHARLDLPPPGGANSFLSLAAYERPPFSVPELAVVAGTEHGRTFLQWNSNVPPRAWVVFSARQVPGAAAAIAAVQEGYPLHRSVLLEQPPPPALSEGASWPSSAANIRAFRRNEIELEIDAPREGLLVMAEAWYPGWRATVDGAAHEVLPVNGWMRGVAVPAGRHQVRVVYEEPMFRRGAWISGLAWAAALVGWTLAGLGRKAPFVT